MTLTYVSMFDARVMNELNGTVTPRFERVCDVVLDALRSGSETGLSLAVDLEGERVVDLWGGHQEPARSQPWERGTLTNVWSITKNVTSLAALLLVDAGALDVHAPVARYWPEFAARGKGRVEVRHLLSHTAGLPGLDQPARLDDLYDARATADRLAAQAPWWEPGTASGYHVLTFGHLVGEVVRRVSGQSLRAFVDEHLSRRVGADFQIGVRAEDLHRVSDVIPPAADADMSGLDPAGVASRTFGGPAFSASSANTSAWRDAELGAANGHGNAASVADLMTPLALEGESAAGRLLHPATVRLVLDEQSRGVDLVNGLYVRWGIGFALADARTLPWIPEGRVVFWGGWGGSMAVADLDRRLTIAYVMNAMGGDILGSARAAAYVRAVYRALGE